MAKARSIEQQAADLVESAVTDDQVLLNMLATEIAKQFVKKASCEGSLMHMLLMKISAEVRSVLGLQERESLGSWHAQAEIRSYIERTAKQAIDAEWTFQINIEAQKAVKLAICAHRQEMITLAETASDMLVKSIIEERVSLMTGSWLDAELRRRLDSAFQWSLSQGQTNPVAVPKLAPVPKRAMNLGAKEDGDAS